MSSEAAAKPSLSGYAMQVRRFFFKMNPREKTLLLLVVVALIALWISSFVGRVSATSNAFALVKEEMGVQELWIDRQPGIEADYERYISRINLSDLPPRDVANSQIDELVRSFNIQRFNLASPRTQEGQSLNFHTYSLTLQQIDFATVMRFTEELKRKLPYLSLQRITIRARPNDDSVLDVSFALKSIEKTS